MAEQISPALRREVASRAGFRREYCLMPEAELFAGCLPGLVTCREDANSSVP